MKRLSSSIALAPYGKFANDAQPDNQQIGTMLPWMYQGPYIENGSLDNQ